MSVLHRATRALKDWARSVVESAPAGLSTTAVRAYRFGLRNRNRTGQVRAARGFRTRMASVRTVAERDGYWWERTSSMTAAGAKADNLALVAGALEQEGIEYFWVRTPGPSRYSLAIVDQHRDELYRILEQLARHRPVYVQVQSRGGTVLPDAIPAAEIPHHHMMATATVVRVAVLRLVDGALPLGPETGIDVELWAKSDSRLYAPRPNSVASDIPISMLAEPDPIEVGQLTLPTIGPFHLPGMHEVQFPIDVVYTWVDGEDPTWKHRMLRARDGDAAPLHPEAVAVNRFDSRDELKYSLRSLELFAPWVNHVYLVTDGQVPSWLDPDATGLTVVDHTEMFDDAAKLPVFNSNAIISQLHRIPDLSEHYVYMNDDVFFGRTTRPEQFFTSGGIAKVFPSANLRPLADPSAEHAPHFNITTNIRAMIEREFGCAISTAIKHTPHAQLRSVHEEMERRYPVEYARTSRSKFRHHEDFAADQLFHYYAQLTGHAVPGAIRYHYVNVQDASHRRVLDEIAARHDRDVFCLNDAPVDAEPIPPEVVSDFLETYFPLPSRFERRG